MWSCNKEENAMRKRILILIGVLGVLSLCSCKLKRENEVELNTTTGNEEQSTEEEILTAKVFKVDYLQEDLETYHYEEYLLETLLQMTYEEALPYRYSETVCSYETNTWEFSAGTKGRFSFSNMEYKKAACYGNIQNDLWKSFTVSGISDWQWRGLCKEEEIDGCSREEAIAFCVPYAEALGILEGEVIIDTYAITLDILEESRIAAPDETFEYICSNDLKRMAEQENWTQQQLLEKWAEINDVPLKDDADAVQWEKKHEAIIVLYRRTLNGFWIDDSAQVAMMIYVPYYGEIVSASGNLPMVEKEVISEGELIPKKEAMSVAMNEKGSIDIQNVELVYTLKKEDEFSPLTELLAYPVWRIDYIKNGQQDSVWVNAMTGYVERVY